jgi:MFS family permease
MSRAVLLLVLLVSTAHALVHVFELSLPSVEQDLSQEYRPGDEAAQKQLSGRMAGAWRLPFGLGALVAGLLVDRLGGRLMLGVYLVGCGTMCLASAWLTSLEAVFASMFAMGSFASIYHPAGLALISHEVEPDELPRALGIHGIFGSLGIGGAPFLVGAILSLTTPPQWRNVYWTLAGPGIALGIVFFLLAASRSDKAALAAITGQANSTNDQARWVSFFTLTLFAVLMGFIYAAVVSFLPRYMDQAGVRLPDTSRQGVRNYLAGGVLLVGCIGQYLAGRFARREKLEWQLTLISLGNIPGLLAMAVASGQGRVWSAVAFAIVHFMHQPIYNSLIAKYTPRSRRSLCYGFSFAMGFGLGSCGALFAGQNFSDRTTFATLAAIALAAASLSGMLWRWESPAAIA